MLLTANNVHTHLIFKGLISAKELVLGNYSVMQSSTHNNILMVTTEDNQYFIKQITAHNSGAKYRLQKDATCLYLIQELDIYEPLQPWVAKYYGYYTDHHFLITELFKNVISLDEFFRNQKKLSDNIYIQMVDILRCIHVPILDQIKSSKSLQFFPQKFPWIFEIDKTPIRPFEEVRAGQEMVIQHMLRHSIFRQCIEESKHLWKNNSLIHGDIKFLNFIISKDEGVKIVDWEYADIGDPLWDVAGLVQNVICNKILMYEKLLNEGQEYYNIPRELHTIWERIAIIWDQYNSKDDLDKLILFTSSRLLQTAVEYNIRTQEIKPSVLKILNTAEHLYTNRKLVVESISSHLKNIHAK